jgi:L-methionine (R)-S-oxide reductase
MADDLIIHAVKREDRYRELLPQLHALISGETDMIANMANICAALKSTMDFFWVGFYIVKNDELVLGPFQGPVACTRIAKGKGVCGAAWQAAETLIVPDVDKFPGHIACSSLSKSEIVVPVMKDGEVVAVLDVDSDKLEDFTSVDEEYLGQIVTLIKM